MCAFPSNFFIITNTTVILSIERDLIYAITANIIIYLGTRRGCDCAFMRNIGVMQILLFVTAIDRMADLQRPLELTGSDGCADTDVKGKSWIIRQHSRTIYHRLVFCSAEVGATEAPAAITKCQRNSNEMSDCDGAISGCSPPAPKAADGPSNASGMYGDFRVMGKEVVM